MGRSDVQRCNRVFGKCSGDSVAVDHIRDTVVDFESIGSMDGLQERFRGGQFLSSTAGFPHPFFPGYPYVRPQFFPGLVGNGDLGGRNILEFFLRQFVRISSEVNARNRLRKE